MRFVRQVRYYRQGNIWHTIPQLTSDEFKDTLEESNNMDDDTVIKTMRKEGKDIIVRLETTESSRVEIVCRPDVPEDIDIRNKTSWWPRLPRLRLPLKGG